LPGLTRQPVQRYRDLRIHMDARVKPAHDE